MQRPKQKKTKTPTRTTMRTLQRPYKNSRSSVGTRHAVSEKRAKLTQAMSETGIKRTRHAVSLHSQTKGRPSLPPCLRGRVSYKRKTNLINGKLRPIRLAVGTRHAVSEKRAKLTQPMSETGMKRTRHAVSLHSQTKGRPSLPPCLRGRVSYKPKTENYHRASRLSP